MDMQELQRRAAEARERRKALGLPPTQQLNPMERLQQKPSAHKAIAAMCWQCQGEDSDPAVKWRIGNCEAGQTCALYNFRPYRNLKNTEQPKALIPTYQSR